MHDCIPETTSSGTLVCYVCRSKLGMTTVAPLPEWARARVYLPPREPKKKVWFRKRKVLTEETKDKYARVIARVKTGESVHCAAQAENTSSGNFYYWAGKLPELSSKLEEARKKAPKRNKKKYTPHRSTQLKVSKALRHVSVGHLVSAACRYAGMNTNTFYRACDPKRLEKARREYDLSQEVQPM